MNLGTLLKYRMILVIIVHAALATLAWYGAWYLRLDRALYDLRVANGIDFLARSNGLLPWVLAARLLALGYFGLFQGLWRYVSLTDLVNLVKAVVAGSALYLAVIAAQGFTDVPRLVLVIEPILCIVFLGGVRFLMRGYREIFAPQGRGGRAVIIVGAGDAGEMMLREMRTHQHLGYNVVGFVDDDPRKLGTKIHDVPVLGTTHDIGHVVKRSGAEEIIVAIRSASAESFRRILDACDSTGARLRRLPNRAADIVRLTELRDVEFQDLLDREEVLIDVAALRQAVEGQVVIVTGAGGSIGSEVVRQLAPLSPELIVALDRAENALFYLERDIAVRFPDAKVEFRIADCQDEAAMGALFRTAKPAFVVHAAAYKHVPLMESHPIEAVRNNVAATLALGKLCLEHGVSRFLLVSSDKAVRPTSVMGATKRAAELALLALDSGTTQFMAVRFGNVLGSEGSVVPLFRRQIREGGPVTVTHRDVSRYFMTIPEAVGLVLQAGVMGKGGEVFHLDMGSPVKVLDLAEKLIRLQGFRPYEDIEIQFIGMRPGEKMHEELLVDGENVGRTDHPLIYVLRRSAPERERLRAQTESLLAATSSDSIAVVRELKALVPSYDPSNDVHRRALAEALQAPGTL